MFQKSAEKHFWREKLKRDNEFIKNKTEEYNARYKKETGMIAPKMDPFLTRLSHREAYRNNQENRKTNPGRMLRKTVMNKEEVSFAPLDTLVRTRISDLQVNVPAKGLYLIARTIEHPIAEVGLRTIIEDHTGDVYIFLVYHMFDSDMTDKPEDVFPLGTVFALKEPLLKTTVVGTHVIRCDSPSDIIFINASHQLYVNIHGISWRNEIKETMSPCKPNTAEEWKKLGNEYFQNNQHYKALEAYFMVLKQNETISDETLTVLYSNIAAVYLKMGNFESGLLYSRKALNLTQDHVKAHYRSGRAHYELRQYEDACHHFEIVTKLDPKNKEVARELAKCIFRFDEESGNVNITKLALTRMHEPRTEIDCADFTGPIEVVQIPEKGRGIVATEYINPGTLLCVSKALCVSFDNELEVQIFENKVNNAFSANTKFVTKVAQAILKNPTVVGRLVNDLPANDSGFGKKLFCEDKTEKEVIVDIDRIQNILDTNGFGLVTDVMGKDSGSALFHIPSYFNHSCVCNAVWEPYNNILIVHAVKPINQGEEIVLSYHNNLGLFCERESNLQMRSLNCFCYLCTLDRSEKPEIQVQREMLLKGKDDLENERSVPVLSRLISDVERTYQKSGRSELKCNLFLLYLHRSYAFLEMKQLKQVKKDAEKALRTVGLSSGDLLGFVEQGKPLPKNCIFNHVIWFAVELIVIYFNKAGNAKETQKWVNVLLALEKMCSGGDINVAKIKYKNVKFLLDEAK